MPVTKGATRAWMHLCGWHLRKVSENETRISMMTEMNLKGSWLPQGALRHGNIVTS